MAVKTCENICTLTNRACDSDSGPSSAWQEYAKDTCALTWAANISDRSACVQQNRITASLTMGPSHMSSEIIFDGQLNCAMDLLAQSTLKVF